MNSSGFKPQQLHPYTLYTSDSICWPVSCFDHDLTWRDCQLVHANVPGSWQGIPVPHLPLTVTFFIDKQREGVSKATLYVANPFAGYM